MSITPQHHGESCVWAQHHITGFINPISGGDKCKVAIVCPTTVLYGGNEADRHAQNLLVFGMEKTCMGDAIDFGQQSATAQWHVKLAWLRHTDFFSPQHKKEQHG